MMNRSMAKSAAYFLQRFLPRRKGCLVLAYHSVGNFDDPYTVSGEEMDWQIAEIKRQGLKIISLEELERMIDTRKVEDGTVVLTYDDGRDDNYTDLFPILQKHNVPATIFSITGCIGKTRESSVRPNPMLNESQMREMQQSGLVDFQPHTVTHPKLTQISLDDARREVQESKKALEQMFTKPCRYFAYPYGRQSPDIRKVLSECGIRIAVSGKRGFVTPASELLLMPRSEVKRSTTRAEFKSILRRGSLR